MEITRKDDRRADQLRPLTVERQFHTHADASLLIKMGGTHVICAVTIEQGVPNFLKDTGQGWITAEYGMLPCATHSRSNREAARGRSGRTYEIQRLIGRSLRMMVDMNLLGEVTLRVDCDVINADGGTRCASITGGALAIGEALAKMVDRGMLAKIPRILPVSAVSVASVGGALLLDPDYEEDSAADVDSNFVMTSQFDLIEVQCTAEGMPLEKDKLLSAIELAEKGIGELLRFWEK